MYPDDFDQTFEEEPRWQFGKPSQVKKATEPLEDDGICYLDKSWHGIHFVLSNAAYDSTLPSGFLMAGKDIGTVDIGYGPARAITASETSQIAAFLLDIDFGKRLRALPSDAFAKADIYPFQDSDFDTYAPYLEEYFEELKSCVTDARNKGLGLIVALV